MNRASLSSEYVEHLTVTVALLFACVALLRQSLYYTRKLELRVADTGSSLIEPFILTLDTEESKEHFRNVSKISRYRVLDIFRGFTLCLMVFVNYGGGGFSLFKHSVWDGLTIADLVFPSFAWILGFSIFFTSSRRPKTSNLVSLSRIGKRTIKLFMLGLFVNNGNNWSEWRLPGVLQGLGIAYLIVGIADWCMPFSRNCSRLTFLLWHLILGVLPLVLTNLLLTFQLPVPGCPIGYIGPGGLADDGVYRNCTGGAHLFIDSMVFGLNHIFQTPTCQKRYQTGPYDPEGLLNWLMVGATAYFGYLQAFLFTNSQEYPHGTRNEMRNRQSRHLLACGTGFILLSILSGGLWIFPNGPWIPLNKNLWSLSYVLLTSGLNAWVLALFVKLVDNDTHVKWSGAPCLSIGKNSIAIYVMHEVFQHFAPFAAKPMRSTEEIPHLEMLLYNLVGVLIWIVVAQWMDLRRLVIKI